MTDFIPVARIADLLLHGGEEFDYNGKRHTYPETRLIYWAVATLPSSSGPEPTGPGLAGPGHHDLSRALLERPGPALRHRPSRHHSLGRTDIGGSGNDDFIFWMEQVIEPVGEAREMTTTSSPISPGAIGVEERFTEGRTAEEWLEHIPPRFHPTIPTSQHSTSYGRRGTFRSLRSGYRPWFRRSSSSATTRRARAEDAFGPDRAVLGDHRRVRL